MYESGLTKLYTNTIKLSTTKLSTNQELFVSDMEW